MNYAMELGRPKILVENDVSLVVLAASKVKTLKKNNTGASS